VSNLPNDVHLFTDAQATDEAVLMLTRRLMRLHPDVYFAVITTLADGLRDALHLADNRADLLRHNDRQAGITRRALTIAEIVDRQLAAEDGEVER